MLKSLPIFVLILFFNNLYAQNKLGYAKGKLKDSIDNRSIGTRKFYIKINTDSLALKTLNDGSFIVQFDPARTNEFFIVVEGYEEKKVILSSKKSNVEIGDVFLSKKNVVLREVTIKQKKEAKDTLDFVMRDSVFRSYDMTEYALKKIPGITIVNNEILYNGVKVNAVHVGGMDFLFNENEFMLNDLPAFAIDKVQLINKNTSNSSSFEPEINVVLKSESNSGFINRFLGAFGTNRRQATNLTVSKIAPDNQMAVSFKSNNINNPDLYNRVTDLQTFPSIINDAELKFIVRKSVKKANFDLSLSYTNNASNSQQATQRTELISDTLIKSGYNNISNIKNKIFDIGDGVEYKINQRSQLSFKQQIDIKNNNSVNITNYDTTGNLGSQLINTISDNDRIFDISNRLNYNYKGKYGRSTNQYFNISFEHEFFNEDKNDKYLLSKKANGDSVSLYKTTINNNSYKLNSRYTANFSGGYTLNFKGDNNLNALQNIPQPGSNILAARYYQTIIDWSADLFKYGKKNDIQIAARFFNYAISDDRKSFKSNTAKLLPLISYTYKFSDFNKVTLEYNKKVNFYTLQQITVMANLNNSILPSVENYSVTPEIIESYSATYILNQNKWNIYLNSGYQKKSNSLSNSITNPNDPIFSLQNVGDSKSGFLSSRYEYNLNKKFKLVLNLNYNYTDFKNQNEDHSISKVYDANLGFSYSYSKIEATISGGYNSNLSNFATSTNLSEYNLSSVIINSNIKLNLPKNLRFLLLTKVLFNDVNNEKNAAIILMTPQISSTFLTNKNLDAFIRAENIFNEGSNILYDVQPSYIQSSRVITLGRFFLFGVQYKFNTLKR